MQALSPLSFVTRAAQVCADTPAVSDGSLRRASTGFITRCRAVAGGGDKIPVLCPNIPEMFRLHFAVPLCGAVLDTINTRLEAETAAYILGHPDSKLLICETALVPLLRAAFALNAQDLPVIKITGAVAGHSPHGHRHAR